MENNMSFFENEDYKLVTNLIDKKINILRRIERFNQQYLRFYDVIDEFEIILDNNQKEKFNEINVLFNNLEEYYLALAYSLGVKYGKELDNI